MTQPLLEPIPPLREQSIIASAMQEAIAATLGKDGSSHCWLYARAGAIVLNTLCGPAHKPVVGWLKAEPAAGQVYLVGWTQMPEDFHTWIERKTFSGTLIIDFWLRHLTLDVAAHGQPWEASYVPPYTWAYKPDVPSYLQYNPLPEHPHYILFRENTELQHVIQLVAASALHCIARDRAAT